MRRREFTPRPQRSRCCLCSGCRRADLGPIRRRDPLIRGQARLSFLSRRPISWNARSYSRALASRTFAEQRSGRPRGSSTSSATPGARTGASRPRSRTRIRGVCNELLARLHRADPQRRGRRRSSITSSATSSSRVQPQARCIVNAASEPSIRLPALPPPIQWVTALRLSRRPRARRSCRLADALMRGRADRPDGRSRLHYPRTAAASRLLGEACCEARKEMRIPARAGAARAEALAGHGEKTLGHDGSAPSWRATRRSVVSQDLT